MIISTLAFSCPLILCSLGALFTEYAGCLALFLEGLISLAAFLDFTFTTLTGSPVLGFILSCSSCVLITFAFSVAVEKFKANHFIAAIAMNLFFGALCSCLSWLLFKTRGVLTSEIYKFGAGEVRLATVILSLIFIAAAVVFLRYSRHGLYIRIAGTSPDVLRAKGINPANIRTLAWCLGALYSSIAGCFLGMRLSSFVPNISSGRGWMALAAVFLGRKKPVIIVISVFIFCAADLLAANIQNYIPNLPSSLLLSFPYILALALILIKKNPTTN